MTTIIGISGSLRSGSFNTSLLRAAREATPADATLEIASISGFPLYDGDVEAANGVPGVVTQLKDRIAAAHGLLLVTPEYNNSIPGPFKNAVDWLTRPSSDIARVFANRPVAVMGATPGRGGTILAQAAWLPILRTLGTLPWFGGRMTVSEAGKVFGADGQLLDEQVRAQLQKFMAGFAAFVRASSIPKV